MEAAAKAWWQIDIVDAGWAEGCRLELTIINANQATAHGAGDPQICGDDPLQTWGGINAEYYYEKWGFDSGDPGCCGEGNPVNAAVGNKYQHEVDFNSGAWLLLERFYNSRRGAAPGIFGHRWSSNFDSRIVVLSSSSNLPRAVAALRADGRTIIFREEKGRLLGPTDTAEKLTQLKGASGEPSGWIYQVPALGGWEKYSASGSLEEIVGSDGLRIVLNYSDSSTPKSIAPHSGLLISAVDTIGRSIRFSYDLYARVVQVELPDGQYISYLYDESHYDGYSGSMLSMVVYQDKRSRAYLYGQGYKRSTVDDVPYLEEIVDEQGVTFASFRYDSRGRVVKSFHAGGVQSHTFDYNSDGVTFVSYPSGMTAPKKYTDVNGRKRLITNGAPCTPLCDVAWKERMFDGAGRIASVKDFNGLVTSFRYGANNLLEQILEAAGDPTLSRKLRIEWDLELMMPLSSSIIDASDKMVSRADVRYNKRGQKASFVHYDPQSGQSRTTTISYCEQSDVDAGRCPLIGLKTSIDGPRADVADITRLEYYASDSPGCAAGPASCSWRKGDLWKVIDALGKFMEVLLYDGAGRVLSVRNYNGVVTDYEYNPRGWLTALKVRGLDDGSEMDDLVTRIEHHATGLISSIKFPGGRSTSYLYDPAHRLTDIMDGDGNRIHYTLDDAGNRISEEVTDESNETKRLSSRSYNQRGLVEIERDAEGNGSTYTYDAGGNITGLVDADMRRSSQTFDALGRPVYMLRDDDGIAAEMSANYDTLNNVVDITDPKGLLTRFKYNGFGEMTGISSPDAGVVTMTLNSVGALATRTDARGITAIYSYDSLNRPVSVSFPDSSQNILMQYDSEPRTCMPFESFGTGRIGRVLHPGGTTEYCYDRFGRTRRKIQMLNGRALTLAYSYTKAGDLSSVTYPDGTLVDYVRNMSGRIIEIGLTRASLPRQVLIRDLSYAPFGPITGWVYGNGRALSRPLDMNYRPKSINDEGIGGLRLELGYDSAGRLTQVREGESSIFAQYEYDGMGRLLRVAGVDGMPTYTYGWDASGNRMYAGGGNGTLAYHYPATTHHLTGVGEEDRTYDDAGNAVQMSGLALSYNNAGRLSEVKLGQALLGTYEYNHRGERLLSWADERISAALYDEWGHWLGEYHDGARALQQVVWLDNYPVAVFTDSLERGPEIKYIQPDHLGTPRNIIDATRDVSIWQWPLLGEPFGADSAYKDPDSDGISFDFPLRFPGQLTMTGTSLNHNYHRDYDPVTGRYIQSDPSGLAGGLSTYLYASANPLMFTDEFGRRSRDFEYIYKRSGATPPPPSPYFGDYAGGVSDFLSNYFDMRSANTKEQDKYFHCKANCEAARRGRGGMDAACNISNAREFFDQTVKGDSADASMADQLANIYGRTHALESACVDVCSGYRPNGLPGNY